MEEEGAEWVQLLQLAVEPMEWLQMARIKAVRDGFKGKYATACSIFIPLHHDQQFLVRVDSAYYIEDKNTSFITYV